MIDIDSIGQSWTLLIFTALPNHAKFFGYFFTLASIFVPLLITVTVMIIRDNFQTHRMDD